MKQQRLFYLILIFYTLHFYLNATSIDGTSSLKYQSTHYVLRDTNTVTGFVRFANGFTILPATNHASSAIMDTCMSCSGGFDLQETSTLKLIGDFILDSATTPTNSGTIYGYNRALKLNGSLTISANQVLHLGGNLIIDGQGNNIFINEHAQLLLDHGATVTIQNATIHNKRNAPGWPALTMTTSLCRLTLSDVELALDSDLYINSGQLFIHNDVAVTGTSALVWHSIAPCTIEPNSNLYFDLGTTFSYAPPCTDKNLIRMTDQSSTLHLNGCSLSSTHTGLRLAKGTVLFDNRITLNSTANNIINTTTSASLTTSIYALTASTPHHCTWSPDGRYISLTAYSSSTLIIYAFNQNTLTRVGNPASTATNPTFSNWSPDEKYLAIVSGADSVLQIFSFSGTTLTQVGSNVSTGTAPWNALWSPDGKYIAVMNNTSNTLQIFTISGKTPIKIGSDIATTSNPAESCWSPDGKYIAVVGNSTNKLQIFSRATFSQVGSDASTDSAPISCSWSPDGKYIAVCNYGSKTLQIFSFSGGTPSQIGSSVSTTDACTGGRWSPDGKYIALVVATGKLLIFNFDGGTPSLVGSTVTTMSSPYFCSWSPNEQYIAVTGAGAEKLLQVFTVNSLVDTNTQATSNGILFGNSSAGATQDATIKILAGTQVVVNGILNVDAT